MNQLKVMGKEHSGQYKFTGIEGGFGKSKKAINIYKSHSNQQQPRRHNFVLYLD